MVFLNIDFSEMFFLVYFHSVTTATELAQVLPRRKAFQGELQPASERLPPKRRAALGKGSIRKVLETGCHESHAPHPQSPPRRREVNHSVPKRRWAVDRGGVAPSLQKGGLEGRVCKS